MKLNHAQRDIESFGIGQTDSFQIAESAAMWEATIDLIYSDKPYAVVREIMKNALDASLMRPEKLNGKPFTVICPSKLNPTFVVRDYGPGLDPEQMKSLYTTLGGSNKRHTNDLNGGFGWGSKAPFCYTDAFTVTSVQNGMKRIYFMYRDETRIPKITRTEETPTDEENGIQVSIPIKVSDLSLFIQKITESLRFFPPNSYKLIGSTVTPNEYSLEGDGWAFIKGHADTRIVMGAVSYPLKWDIIFPGQTNSYGSRNKYPSQGLEFRMPIGSLKISPSREELSYTPETIQKIREQYQKFTAECENLAREKLAVFPTDWEKRNAFYGMRYQSQGIGPFLNGIDMGNPGVKFADDYPHNRAFILYAGSDLQRVTLPDNTARMDFTTHGTLENNIIFIIDDMVDQSAGKRRVWSKIKSVIAEAGGKNINYVCLVHGNDKEQTNKALGGPGVDKFRFLSEIKLPDIVREVKSGKATAFRYAAYDRQYGQKNDWIQYELECGPNAPFRLYVPTKATEFESELDKAMMRSPLIYLHGPKIGGHKTNPSIFGLPKRFREEMDMTGFMSIQEWHKGQVDTFLGANPTILDDYTLRLRLTERDQVLLTEGVANLSLFLSKVHHSLDDPDMEKVRQESHRKKPYLSNQDLDVINFCVKHDLVTLPTIEVPSISAEAKAVATRYPIFFSVVSTMYDGNWKDVGFRNLLRLTELQ